MVLGVLELSQYGLIIITSVLPLEWVLLNPLILDLGVRAVIGSTDNIFVILTEIDLGGSLRVLILKLDQRLFLLLAGNSSFSDSIRGQLNEDKVIIITTVGPAQWVCPSTELGFLWVALIELSKECSVVIELTKIWSNLPLNVLLVFWGFILTIAIAIRGI